MKLASRFMLATAFLAAAFLSFCGVAGAANFVIGPNLTGSSWMKEECEVASCTVANYELGGTGPTLTSPVDGAIVSFSVLGGSTGTYRLRTVKPGESSVSWFFGKEAAPVPAVPNAGVQAYPVSLPIRAGETIGLTMSKTASIVFQEVGRSSLWETEPPESGHALGISNPEVWGFNAEVQPAPTVAALGTASGPTAGGTAVAISGTDFANVTGVSFGGAPASFSVASEGLLTAVAPVRAVAGAVSVTVTTVAGKANAPQLFTYEAPPAPPAPPVQQCVVPSLKGKTLKAAKTALENAKCKLGKVTKLAGATAKSGKVTKQGAKAGAKVVVGTKVDLTLKPPKPAHRKGGKGKH